MKYTTKQLKYEDILQYVSEEDIALFYLGVTSNCKLFSYFREETIPGKYLYYKNGRMQYFDCIEHRSLPYLIMELNNWSYSQFILHLRQDFLGNVISTGKKKNSVKPKIKDKPTEIKIKKRAWQDYDLAYWKQFNISLEILELYNVVPVEYFWVNDIISIADKYCYSYNFYWESGIYRRKLYSPFSKEVKWLGNGGKVCQGHVNLPKEGDLLIISKALKDVMTLYSLGYHAVAPPSESTFLPEKYFFKQKERFKDIVIFYDNDIPGIKKSTEFSERYNIKNISIPDTEVKDISDYIKVYGVDKTRELLKTLL